MADYLEYSRNSRCGFTGSQIIIIIVIIIIIIIAIVANATIATAVTIPSVTILIPCFVLGRFKINF